MNGWVSGLEKRGGYRNGDSYAQGYRAGYNGGIYQMRFTWRLWRTWGDFRGYSKGYRDGINDQQIESFGGLGKYCEY